MNELWSALWTRLSGGTALTTLLSSGTASIHHLQVPGGSGYPCLTFGVRSGGDEIDNPHRRVDMTVLIKAISNVGAKEAGAIDSAADTLLHGSPLTVSGWTNTSLMREGERIEYVEATPAGDLFYHVGGVYRARLSK